MRISRQGARIWAQIRAQIRAKISGRDAAIVAGIVALIACAWLSVTETNVADPGQLRKYYVHILAYSYLVLLLPPILAGRRMASILSALAAVLLTIAFAADLTAVRFFDAAFLNLYPYLPVKADNATPAAVLGYAASYVPGGVWLLAVLTIAVGLGAARWLRNRQQARLMVAVALPLCYLALTAVAFVSHRPDPQLAGLMAEPRQPLQKLTRTDRSGSFSMTRAPLAEPETIILVVMESTGADAPASNGQALLSESIIAASRAGNWVNFPNAVTSSNATDISVPSLLTGAGADETIGKIGALPFLWQYAAARGYQTGFVTSSTMNWAGFDDFLSGGRLDRMVSSSDSGLPFVNDLAVDDHFVYQTAAQTIRDTPGKLFLTLYPQALHWPFQTQSAFAVPASITGRREQAAYIAEAGLAMMFDTLRATDRLDDALIVIVGDHGEFDFTAKLRAQRGRIATFEEGILSPIFLIKAPATMPARESGVLAANAQSLVANVDIAPTMADLLGGTLTHGQAYTGFSLLRPVPADRVVYSASTNQWRHWTKSAIAVSRGKERLTCDSVMLCRMHRSDKGQLVAMRPAGPGDGLFDLAAGNPILREGLAQIYRDYYR